jgi:hypothetical protein
VKPQLHVSGLNLLARCGEAFRRRYVEGEIIPPGVAAVTGTAVDRAVTANLGAKIERGDLLPVEAVADTARDALVATWQQGVKLTDDEAAEGVARVKGAAVDKAVRLAETHAIATAPALEPTHVQRTFVVELGGYPYDLAGTIDVQEGARAIRDTKTSAKTPPVTIAETSDQLTAYALAVKAIDGTAPARVALDYLIDLKGGPKAVTVESVRDPADFDGFLRRTETAIRVIEAGAFMPAERDHWMCNARFCGYHATCPFARRPVQISATGRVA